MVNSVSMNYGNDAKRHRNGESHLEGRGKNDGDVEERVLGEDKEGNQDVDVVTVETDKEGSKGTGARSEQRRRECVGQTGGRSARKSRLSMRELASVSSPDIDEDYVVRYYRPVLRPLYLRRHAEEEKHDKVMRLPLLLDDRRAVLGMGRGYRISEMTENIDNNDTRCYGTREGKLEVNENCRHSTRRWY